MAETIVPESPATPAPKGLIARFIGVLISPRDTYADIARRPTWLGMWLLVTVVTTVCAGWLSSTPVGRRAAIEATTKVTSSFGIQIPPERLDAIRDQIMNAPAWRTYAQTGGGSLIFVPLIVAAITAGILIGIFNALLGGDAKFKQVFAIVMFSNAIIVIKTVFVTPLNYARESLSNPTTFAALLPMLDENSLPAKMLGSIDFFLLWWLVSLAIGLGVLYKRPTRGIATALIGVYVVLAVTIAAGLRAHSRIGRGLNIVSRTKKILIGVVVVVLAAAIVGANLWFKKEKGLAVTSEAIKTRDLDAIVSASGKIQPKRLVNISADLPGRVVNLAVNEGDRIHQGQFLMQIDPKSASTRVDSNAASLEAAQVTLDQMRQSVETGRVQVHQAQQNLKRQQDLWRMQLTTREALDKAENDVKAAESALQEREKSANAQASRIAQERAGLESARYDLEQAAHPVAD